MFDLLIVRAEQFIDDAEYKDFKELYDFLIDDIINIKQRKKLDALRVRVSNIMDNQINSVIRKHIKKIKTKIENKKPMRLYEPYKDYLYSEEHKQDIDKLLDYISLERRGYDFEALYKQYKRNGEFRDLIEYSREIEWLDNQFRTNRHYFPYSEHNIARFYEHLNGCKSMIEQYWQPMIEQIDTAIASHSAYEKYMKEKKG